MEHSPAVKLGFVSRNILHPMILANFETHFGVNKLLTVRKKNRRNIEP